MRRAGLPLARALLAAWLAAAPFAATAASSGPAAPNLLVLEVRLDQQLLSDALTGFQYGNDVYLPLGELSKLLTIAITTDPVAGRASGFVLEEQRSFSLNVLEREVALSGHVEPVDRSRFKLQADDIYVSSRLLARWLPVDLDVDMSSLLLRVHPREQLPLQARLARGRLRPGLRQVADPGYPRQATPYALAGMPFVDQTFSLDLRHGSAAQANYTAYLTGDLLGLQAALYANEGPGVLGPNLRMTVGRRDPDGNLLGPLHARSALVGNVTVPGVPGISYASVIGNGVSLSNRPLNQPTSFDRHTFQGDLPPGWDVELYFNNALVGYQASRPDGKYVFEDQPLVYGPNEFRLVFHGPLGQVRVERQSFLLEQSALAPGQLVYDFAAHRDLYGNRRAVARLDLGLPGGLTASAGAARAPLFGGEQRYVDAALREYWHSFIAGLDVARAGDGGALAHAELKTRIGSVALSAGHAAVRDFASEIYLPSSDPIRARDELRADAIVPLGERAVLPLSLQARRDRLASGETNTEVLGRMSAYHAGTALSNVLRLQLLRGNKYEDGAFQLSRRVGAIGLTGQLAYTIAPRREMASAALMADKLLAPGYLLNFGVQHNFQDPRSDFSAALNKSLGSFGLGINAHYSTNGDYGAGLQLFLALGQEPRSGAWLADALPMAGSGAASARVFLDKNLNGVMDGDDEPIRNVGLTVNGGTQPGRTDAAGISYLSRLPPNQPTDVAIDTETLEDPQWMARDNGVRVVPRPGKVARLEFPVILTGEVDGTTYIVAHGAKRTIGELELELVDRQRKVAATATSAVDGYFVFSNVPPGDYLLRVSRAQLRRLGMTDLGMHLLTVPRDGSFVNGRELYVEKTSEPDAPDPQAN